METLTRSRRTSSVTGCLWSYNIAWWHWMSAGFLSSQRRPGRKNQVEKNNNNMRIRIPLKNNNNKLTSLRFTEDLSSYGLLMKIQARTGKSDCRRNTWGCINKLGDAVFIAASSSLWNTGPEGVSGGEATLLFPPNNLRICPSRRTKAAHSGHDLRRKVWVFIRDHLWMLKPSNCDPESSSRQTVEGLKRQMAAVQNQHTGVNTRSKESLRCTTRMWSHRPPWGGGVTAVPQDTEQTQSVLLAPVLPLNLVQNPSTNMWHVVFREMLLMKFLLGKSMINFCVFLEVEKRK